MCREKGASLPSMPAPSPCPGSGGAAPHYCCILGGAPSPRQEAELTQAQVEWNDLDALPTKACMAEY